MADGLRAGDPASGALIEKQLLICDNVMECKAVNDNVIDLFGANVSGSANFLCNLSEDNGDKGEIKSDKSVTAEKEREGLLPVVCDPEDCRKKRCVDRYDSSESSDSGVAVLSCTDCSGSSSTSDLTDPGSPFSSASSHSSTAEDNHPPKMPPAQTAHYPPWPWTAKDGDDTQATNPDSPPRMGIQNSTTVERRFIVEQNSGLIPRLPEKHTVDVKKNLLDGPLRSPNVTNLTTAQSKRSLQEKTSYAKRLKATVTEKQQAAKKQINRKLISEKNSILESKKLDVVVEPSPNNNNNYKLNKNRVDKAAEQITKMQQGKITEYFKTQAKVNGLKKELFKGKPNKLTTLPINNLQIKPQPVIIKEPRTPTAKKPMDQKSRKYSPTVPRKILPAPSKISENNIGLNKNITLSSQLNRINKNIALNGINKSITINTPMHPNPISTMHPFTPTMTLTAVSFPSNLAYLHTKTPKPPDNVFVPQMPQINLINHSSCLNIVQPVNNFSCTLNATVVPIVKLNTLPSTINGSNLTNVGSSLPLNVETAVPTVLTPKPKIVQSTNAIVPPPIAQIPKQYTTPTLVNQVEKCRERKNSCVEEPYRTEECQMQHHDNSDIEKTNRVHKSPSITDSESGVSSLSSNLSTDSSKECLKVAITEAVIVECQKSPILSQPKVIRFPRIKDPQKEKKDDSSSSSRSSSHSNDGRCKWNECSSQFDASGALLEHLQVKHVISQSQANKEEQYVCLWRGCKVYGRKSCSVSWLERHVLAHAGTKPFRCIVDGCGLRFTTQLMLERHVNNHFNSDGSPNNSAKKSVENGSSKLFKRNGRIIRFRRQPWSARMFDFIDSGIMEGLQHKVLQMTHAKASGQARTDGDVVHLRSQVLARKTTSDGTVNFLVQWKPAEICPDEWVSEKEYKSTKTVSVSSLSQSSRETLRLKLFPSGSPVRKHRRKPVKMKFDTT